MTLELLYKSTGLFVGLFAVGTVLCLQLYKWDMTRFFRDPLWTKILMWIPLYIGLIAILFLKLYAAVALLTILILLAAKELYKLKQKSKRSIIYAVVIGLCCVHIALPFVSLDEKTATYLLLVVAFSSVLSDVFAYFFGSYIGGHKLPSFINPKKSWEGVLGQIVGSFVGFALIVGLLGVSVPIVLALIVGVASAFGDIANSIVKRSAGIKDWGMTIPGHGGVLDRFASLAVAIAASYWWAVLSGWHA